MASRRPGVDLLMIGLTWSILLFHTCRVYTPAKFYYVFYPEHVEDTPANDDKYTIIPLDHLVLAFSNFLSCWNMPMFFFISGSNVYFAFFRRTETQFRQERVHRLLVPALAFSLVTQIPLSFDYFAPLTPECQDLYEGVNSTSNMPCNMNTNVLPFLRMFTKNTTFLSHLQQNYKTLNVSQTWFLWFLFVFSQLFAGIFRSLHPHHNKQENKICFFLSSHSFTLHQFWSAVSRMFGDPYRLVLLPGLSIGILQASSNVLPYFLLSSFPFLPYLAIFLLGYAVSASEDQEGMLTTIISNNRWIHLLLGSLCCVLHAFLQLFMDLKAPAENTISLKVILGLSRGISQWLFILGVSSFARVTLLTPYTWIKPLRDMSLPFYLIHQQVLVSLLAGLLWIPKARSLPVVLTLATIITTIFSFLITKSGSFRYFFGLQPPKGSILPGKLMRGFSPTVVLGLLVILQIIVANSI